MVPDLRRRRAPRACPSCVVFDHHRAVHVLPRRAVCPSRGELVEQRPARGAAPPNGWLCTAPIVAVVCAVALVVLPVRLPPGAREHDDRDADRALAGRDHRLRRPDLGRAADAWPACAGFVDLASGGQRRDRVSDGRRCWARGRGRCLGLVTAVSALRVRGVSLAVVTLAAAVAITQFGFNNTTWGGGQTGSPGARAERCSASTSARSRRSADWTGTSRARSSAGSCWRSPCCCACSSGSCAGARLGQRMLAVRSNERAAAAAGDQPAQRQADRVRRSAR